MKKKFFNKIMTDKVIAVINHIILKWQPLFWSLIIVCLMYICWRWSGRDKHIQAPIKYGKQIEFKN